MVFAVIMMLSIYNSIRVSLDIQNTTLGSVFLVCFWGSNLFLGGVWMSRVWCIYQICSYIESMFLVHVGKYNIHRSFVYSL